jgi:RHS repeat-associated protein
MTDGTGSSTWAYDSLHRLTSYKNGNGVTVGYTYNLRNEPLTVVYPGTSHTVTYGYDAAGRMNSLKDWLSTTANTFGYDANSNLTTDTLRNGVTDTYASNAADQLTSISDKIGSTTILAATYTRDSNGQLATDSSQSTNQRDYKYTALNQLCYAGSANSTACTSPPTSSFPYAYDNADNLTTIENAAHTGKNTQQFNNADELCWVVGGTSTNACGTAPTGATTFGYNSNGDRTSKVPSSGSATCDTYDQANRLTQIQTGTGSTCTTPTTVGTYAYDGNGVRESKTVGGTTTQFVWDGAGGNLLDEKAGSSNPLYYIYGPGGVPVEQVDTSGVAHFYSHDQLGSTRTISSATGAVQNTDSYDPYGNAVSSTGSVTNHLKFSGQYQDAESGLYSLRARYYDPTTAQFLTHDPALAKTRSPYAYVAGNPLNATDPSGDRPADFYLMQIGIGPWTATVGVSSRGHWYAAGGLSKSLKFGSGQVWAGWIDPSTVVSGQCATEDEIKSFISGPAAQVGATYGGGAGLLYGNPGKFGRRDVALLVGLGTPQASGGGDFGIPIADPLYPAEQIWNVLLSPTSSPADSPTDTDPNYFQHHL